MMTDIIQNYGSILKTSVLFRGLSDLRLQSVLDCFQATCKAYSKGDFLVGTDQTMLNFGFVLAGAVQVIMDDINGDRVIMANVSSGVTFGEALCYTGRMTDIYIIATTDCKIMWLNCRNLLEKPTVNPDAQRGFVELLANRTLQMNDRIQVLSKKSLRAKLNTFFTQCVLQYNATDFTLTMDRESMAAYLGIDRSALSRELSKMREEGLLEFRKNHFRLLHTESKYGS